MSEEAVVVPAPGGNKKLLMAVLAFNVIIAGGLGYLVLYGQKGHAAEKPPEEHDKHAKGFGPLVDVGSLVANLKGPDATHYLKVSLQVEATNEETKKNLEAAVVPIRSEALLYLSGMETKDVSGQDKMRAISQELQTRIAAMVGKDAVHRVFLSEWVIQ
jgi:flagellar basal body-associated protein FliL